jgi:serine/threonine-protein kinase HipA
VRCHAGNYAALHADKPSAFQMLSYTPLQQADETIRLVSFMVSVAQYEGMNHEMAMAYGDEFAIANIRPYDWALLAQAVSAPRGLLVREMRRMARLAEVQALEQTADGIYAQEERDMVGRLSAFVVQQARALAEAAEATSSVELD